jgi:hypothetical protein
VSLLALGSWQLKSSGEQLVAMNKRLQVDGQQSPSSQLQADRQKAFCLSSYTL